MVGIALIGARTYMLLPGIVVMCIILYSKEMVNGSSGRKGTVQEPEPLVKNSAMQAMGVIRTVQGI